MSPTKLNLTEKQHKRLAELLKIRLTPYIPHAPHPTQHAFLWLTCLEALYGGAAGGGKAACIVTPVATPSGWTTMGDLKPGDYVFGMDGHPTEVVACSEIMVDRPCYKITFDDRTSIVCDAEHRWLTQTLTERSQAIRSTEYSRRARRINRPSRAGSNRTLTQRVAIIKSNRKRAARARREGTLSRPSVGTIRETYEIAASVKARGGTHLNHSVPNGGSLYLPHADLLVDPYVLGAWLGDGSRSSGQIGIFEQGMIDQLVACGCSLTDRDTMGSFTVHGLAANLRKLGLIGHKRIPMEYLRSSHEQRVSLLQGLMDTDGSCNKHGQCAISSSFPALANDILALLRTLGIKATTRATASYLGKARKRDRYRFKFTTHIPVFRLERKLERQRLHRDWRGTQDHRYVVACERVPSVPVRCIQVAAEDGMFLAGRQMVPTHNSDALLMAALQYVDVPGYNAILFRKTYADLNLPGSLIPRSHEWLDQSDARWNENDARWTFPSGATLSFGYMRNDDDRHRYQSAEFLFIGVDEVTHFSKLQYTYMFSRLRKPADLGQRNPLTKVPLRMRCASNPGGRGHLWVKQRFIKARGQREDEPEDPTQRVFIPAKLDDNPSVDAESYRKALEQLDEATQMQLIHGDWDAREPGPWVIPDPTWIDAAAAKGLELWEQGGVPRDFEKPICFGIDWGEFTQAYMITPMPNGGIYVLPSEIVGEHDDPGSVGLRMLKRAEVMGIKPAVARYDAAGIQSMRTFAHTARTREGWERLKTQKIAFGKYKKESMNYLKLLFKRVAADKPDRIIAIHPENQVLLRQLRGWVRKDDESEDVDKFDDHGCDAIVAGVAPTAAAHRAYIEAMVQKAKERKKETQ